MRTLEQVLDDLDQYTTRDERKSRIIYLFQTNRITGEVYRAAWKTLFSRRQNRCSVGSRLGDRQ